MARLPRRLSNSGYMHLIERGIGKQIIFETDKDYYFYLKMLRKYSSETGVTICAYCLMDNHVHLLVHDMNVMVPEMMKKIGVCYSGYYNKKYERSGHLFQNRYLSETVEDEKYFLSVFRYILNNPVKAGICPAAKYEWSSYRQYGDSASFTDTTLLCKLLGDYTQYEAFITEENNDACLEFEPIKRDDEWAKQVIYSSLRVKSGTALQAYGRAERDKALRVLKEKGLTIRQIERLTGINRGAIQRA